MATALALATAGLWAGACTNERLDIPCPDVASGDLVVTEIHGKQSGEDKYGEWIEVFNPTGRSIDISGLSVAIIKLDGSSQSEVLVRSQLVIEAGQYATFGKQVTGAEPAHIDYGYMSEKEFSEDNDHLFDSGAIEISSCGSRVDLLVYRNLPTKGSLALDGAINPPTAEANDNEMRWCVDDREDENSELAGIKGTPREENPPCPE